MESKGVEQFVARLLEELDEVIGPKVEADASRGVLSHDPAERYISLRILRQVIERAAQEKKPPAPPPPSPVPFRSRVKETGQPQSMWKPSPSKDQPTREAVATAYTPEEEREALMQGFRYPEDRNEDLGPKRPWEPRGW